MVQPWMGKVASFGAPVFRPHSLVCRKGSVRLCGATPAGTHLSLERISNERTSREQTSAFGLLELVGNSSHPDLSKNAVGGYRLSTTSNLVRVSQGTRCVVYLGVGHVHRSEGALNEKMQMLEDREKGRNASFHARRRRTHRRRRQKELAVASSGATDGNGTEPERTFMWGFHYTHFLYALEPHAPFRVIATSREFCLAAEQDQSDCESIQFVSGLTLAPSGRELLLSYGINDCEAKVVKMPLSRMWAMLQPLDGLDAGAAAAVQQCGGVVGL